jgi:hypothetical protein
MGEEGLCIELAGDALTLGELLGVVGGQRVNADREDRSTEIMVYETACAVLNSTWAIRA